MFVLCPPVFRRSVVVYKSDLNGVDKQRQDRTEKDLDRIVSSGMSKGVASPPTLHGQQAQRKNARDIEDNVGAAQLNASL